MSTLQLINLGQYANDGTGDDLRTAFEKVNENFTTLNLTLGVTAATNLGVGAQVFKQKSGNTLEFRSFRSPDSSVTIGSDNDSITLSVTTNLSTDPHPTLGGDLNLNNHIVYNGDVHTTVYGYSVPFTSNLLELILSGNTYNIDFGSINDPTGGGSGGIDLDFGDLTYDDFSNGLDFGTITIPTGVGGSGGNGGGITYTPPQSITPTIVDNILTLDCNYAWHIVTLDQNITQVNFVNAPTAPGIVDIIVEFTQDIIGSWSMTSPTYLTLGGAVPLQSEPYARSLVRFLSSDGATTVYASYIGGGWV